MNQALWLSRSALSYPSMPAVACGRRVVASYGELAERAARVAGALRGRFRLAPGDRVAIAAKNTPDYLALLYGICELVGVRVRGEMGVPGSIEGVPFAATVVRADLDSGNCAICFASPYLTR